jgi:3',5'-nucleoside bisphosphate phosphatase
LRIDLHIHSTASDGSLSPAAVVSAARAGGLHVIAVTDHDTVAGVLPAQVAAEGQLHVVPAVELSTFHDGTELHMLGYYVDPLEPGLVAFGLRAASRREERMRDMLERLAGLGLHVAWDDVLAAAGPRPESVGRPHLARALLQRGYVSTIPDAFDRFIGDDGPAFVATRLVTPAEAIELIHAARGVAVWAHPRLDSFAAELPRLIHWGLDGVECYRPRNAGSEIQYLEGIAQQHDLLVTGGSDWHGDWHGPLGTFAVDREDIAAFLEVGGI